MKYEKKTEPFYHTAAWERVRALVLQRDYGMCADCLEKIKLGYGQKPRRATMVHHIIPYKERPDLALDMDNLIALCDKCHEARHPEKHGKPEKTQEGMRVIKV